MVKIKRFLKKVSYSRMAVYVVLGGVFMLAGLALGYFALQGYARKPLLLLAASGALGLTGGVAIVRAMWLYPRVTLNYKELVHSPRYPRRYRRTRLQPQSSEG